MCFQIGNRLLSIDFFLFSFKTVKFGKCLFDIHVFNAKEVDKNIHTSIFITKSKKVLVIKLSTIWKHLELIKFKNTI